MYSLFILIYGLILRIASLFNKKAKLLVKGHGQTFSILQEKLVPGAKYIWFHAASLGEFEQGRPLIEKIREQYPQYKIVLTFFSPSGYEVRKNYEGAEIVCYLPLDVFYNSEKFIKMVNPEMVFFIKYEFWANYIYKLKKRNIPLYSVASIFRPDQAFFKPYGFMYARMLKCFSHFYVQNEVSRDLLKTINITDVTVVGDTRFDRVLEIRDKAPEVPAAQLFAGKDVDNILVAGSTWPPDEDIIIDYFNSHPEQRLILAPHVVSEAHLKEIESKLQRPSVRFTQASDETVVNADCLIIDCYGKLSSIYRYGRTAYIGGGFGVGIHNVPEAAVYGVPTIVGPNNKNFREVQYLLKEGATFEIQSSADYEKLMNQFALDKAFHDAAGIKAQEYIQNEAGAVEKIMNSINF